MSTPTITTTSSHTRNQNHTLLALFHENKALRTRPRRDRPVDFTYIPRTRSATATGTRFTEGTPEQVKAIIDQYILSGKKVRLFFGDQITGRDWLQEEGVIGCMSKGVESAPMPLLSKEKGAAAEMIRDEAIVRIMDVTTGKELYRHHSYFLPQLEIRECLVGKPNTHGVWSGPVKLGGFTSYAKAAAWIAFMSGEIMQKPVVGR